MGVYDYVHSASAEKARTEGCGGAPTAKPSSGSTLDTVAAPPGGRRATEALRSPLASRQAPRSPQRRTRRAACDATEHSNTRAAASPSCTHLLSGRGERRLPDHAQLLITATPADQHFWCQRVNVLIQVRLPRRAVTWAVLSCPGSIWPTLWATRRAVLTTS